MNNPLQYKDITTQLVKDTLGETTNNVGALCTSSKINMWSRHKPVRDSRIVLSYSEVGKGADGMYGLNIPKWQGDDTLLTTYARPRGAGGQYSEPYRLGDFRGYFDRKILPITLLSQPNRITLGNQSGTGSLQPDDTYSAPTPGSPFVTLDALGMQLCTFYYRHVDGHFIGWSPSLYYDFGEATEMRIDIKFGLIPTTQAAQLNSWYTSLPSSNLNIYELPRENATQNKNWFNIPLKSGTLVITNWNVLVRRDLNKLQYSIEANYGFSATIVIKEQGSDTTVYQFSVYVNANQIASGYKLLDTTPLVQGKSYVAYLYDGQTLKDSKSI